MNYNEIKFIDSDLREALRRKYANTPTLPADFKERIMDDHRDGSTDHFSAKALVK